MIRLQLIVLSIISLSACSVTDTPDFDTDIPIDLREANTARSHWEGTQEGMAMLDFLNHPSTSYELLDDDVALDRRAAGNLISHRDGWDLVSGTSDDDLFTSIDEVDAVRWVGPSAIGKMMDYAASNGWMLTGDDVLGTWDRVQFTVDEAAAVVELANTAGPNTLDDNIGLDSRAADSIVDARPVSSVHEIAGLYYVGKSALTKLKDYAAGEEGCEVPGWETEYVYLDDAAAWEDRVPAGLVALVEQVLETDDWCGEAYGEPWFVKATIDRFECEEKGYTLELGQGMLEYPEISWYIEFEVDMDFGLGYGVCEV
jgi:hypothetical protein